MSVLFRLNRAKSLIFSNKQCPFLHFRVLRGGIFKDLPADCCWLVFWSHIRQYVRYVLSFVIYSLVYLFFWIIYILEILWKAEENAELPSFYRLKMGKLKNQNQRIPELEIGNQLKNSTRNKGSNSTKNCKFRKIEGKL